jgi:hypothetical protein
MKLKKYPSLFVLLLFALNAFSQRPAIVISDKPGWHRIGEVALDMKNDTSSLEVIGADAFSALRLKVLNGYAGLAEMIVQYEEGPDQVISFYQTLKPDEQTVSFPLNAAEKALRKISIVGKTMPDSVEQKAHLRIMGFKPPGPRK